MTGVGFVAAGAVGGAWARYLLGEYLDARLDDGGDGNRTKHISTFAVNVLGSFIAGVVLGVAPRESVSFFVSVGFCGALTTFSSFAVETTTLAGRDRPMLAALNAVGTLAGALVAVAAGIAVGLRMS